MTAASLGAVDREERWLPVAIAPYYEVSDLGRVRRASDGRIMKLQPKGTTGYVSAPLGAGGKTRNRPVHRLVAEAFIGPGDGLEVNHKDGNKANNEVSNLEWVTRSQNEYHSIYTLGKKGRKPVFALHSSGECRSFLSTRQAERELGLWPKSATKCMLGRKDTTHTHGWRFVRFDDIPSFYEERRAERTAPAPPPADAVRALDWIAVHGTFGVDSQTGEVGGNGQKRVPATRANIAAAMMAGTLSAAPAGECKCLPLSYGLGREESTCDACKAARSSINPAPTFSKPIDDPPAAAPTPERAKQWEPEPCPTCGGFCGDTGPTCAEAVLPPVDVARFGLNGDRMCRYEQGGWVAFADYARLADDLAAAREESAALRKALPPEGADLPTWQEAAGWWRQRAEAAEADAGWLPIESAPKGREWEEVYILLATVGDPDPDTGHEPHATLGWWVAAEADGVDFMGHDGGFVDHTLNSFWPSRSIGNPKYFDEGRQPTHWRPIPAPPAIAKEPKHDP